MKVTPEPKRRRVNAKSGGGRRRRPRKVDYTGQDESDGSVTERDKNESEGGITESDENEGGTSIGVGTVIRKQFGRKYYRGLVDREPSRVKNRKGKLVDSWHVFYTDGDEEELEAEELLPLVLPPYEPSRGMVIRKLRSGDYYQGKVESGPTWIKDPGTGEGVPKWHVLYEDFKEEYLSRGELQLWATDDAELSTKELKSSSKKAKYKRATKWLDHKDIKEVLISKDLKFLGFTEKQIDDVLDKMNAPYGLNEAVQLIREAMPGYDKSGEAGKFDPHKGLKIRKNFEGETYYGEVISDEWEKTTDDSGAQFKTWKVSA
jgi:hypothetical protein